MNTIINKTDTKSRQDRPNATIRLKGGVNRETYHYRDNIYREFYRYHSGPRESCEDITCAECGSYVGDQYKKCKQNCFHERRDEIVACCQRSCTGMGKECIDACDNEMTFF